MKNDKETFFLFFLKKKRVSYRLVAQYMDGAQTDLQPKKSAVIFCSLFDFVKYSQAMPEHSGVLNNDYN